MCEVRSGLREVPDISLRTAIAESHPGCYAVGEIFGLPRPEKGFVVGKPFEFLN